MHVIAPTSYNNTTNLCIVAIELVLAYHHWNDKKHLPTQKYHTIVVQFHHIVGS